MLKHIFNEETYVKHLLEGYYPLSASTDFGNIIMLGKYYNKQGMAQEEISNKIIEIYQKYDRKSNRYDLENKIANLSGCFNTELHEIDKLSVSETEIKSIKTFPKAEERKILFTLIMLAKYCDAVSKNGGEHWISSFPLEDIKAISNVSCNNFAFVKALKEFEKKGLITLTKWLNVQVLCLDDTGMKMYVRSVNNLGYIYMRLIKKDKNYGICPDCGCGIRVKKSFGCRCAKCSTLVKWRKNHKKFF